MVKNLIFIICVLLTSEAAVSQEADTIPQRKNNIKLDLTSYFLYRNAIVLGYERVVRQNQTFVISAGYQEFPKMTSFGSKIGVKNDGKRNGFKVGGDYRFYLKKENKYHAPHGIYLGPYLMYHQYNNTRTVDVEHDDGTQEEVILDSKFSILNLGVQLGYQFVIKDRWTIDLTFVGPSLSRYLYTLDFRGNYTFNKEDIQNEIILDLLDKFPLLDEAVSEKEATKNGKLDTWSYGYRYQLTVGYHFGRKK
jgi:hypothetical protein